jgi:starch-binding outer membrane protein, SusD/RagB family
MKKIIIYAAILVLTMTMSACDDVLNVAATTKYSESTAYASLSNLDLYVKSFYGTLYTSNICEIRSYKMSDNFTDLVKASWYNVDEGLPNRFFYVSNFMTPTNCESILGLWTDMYTRIREVNEFLCDVTDGELSNLDQDSVAVRVAEARFLRAFAYQKLVTRHGGVILRTSETSVDDQNEKNKARSSASDCWDFIISEYKKAATNLPITWNSDNTGRITKGAAWGMIARAALYAERWDEAINACDSVQALGVYKLLDTYQDIFTTTNNAELLLTVNFKSPDLQHYFDYYFCPPYDLNNTVGAAATPTDEFASKFDIEIDGTWKTFDWDEVIGKGLDPWTNRDPRFYSTILYNGASWKGRTIQLYKGGTDGYMDYSNESQDYVHHSTTGYLFRKYIQEKTTEDFTTTLSDQFWIEMRYAEIYLILSEAYARKSEFDLAYKYLNVLRTTRSSVQLPELTTTYTWDSYLTNLSKERICELGLEGHRYWDLCRWGIASNVLNDTKMHGIKITKNSDNTFSYSRVECDTQDRLFPEKYSIIPVPYTEIKNNSLCEQDDLWK